MVIFKSMLSVLRLCKSFSRFQLNETIKILQTVSGVQEFYVLFGELSHEYNMVWIITGNNNNKNSIGAFILSNRRYNDGELEVECKVPSDFKHLKASIDSGEAAFIFKAPPNRYRKAQIVLPIIRNKSCLLNVFKHMFKYTAYS